MSISFKKHFRTEKMDSYYCWVFWIQAFQCSAASAHLPTSLIEFNFVISDVIPWNPTARQPVY